MNNKSVLHSDPGKSSLLTSSLKPLTVVIPSSWSHTHKHKREPSIQSQSSSTLLSPSWSMLSFDQLSLYARRASNSSLSLLNAPGTFSPKNPSITSSLEDENKRRRLKEKIQQAINGFSQSFLLSINDSSLGFYRISDHIQRKVPDMVDTRKRLNQLSKRIDTANTDIEDIRRDVSDIERLEAFLNIHQMIRTSLGIIKAAKDKK
ncbi:hypothetical protein BDB01DRAFT_810748 [Pilobolus umbonatus]|nr:hypothetical protein BDB01DRAFT_810748 [Pilobolus umbonatus]